MLQPDDDHVWTKHIADLWTKYIVVFLVDLFCNLIIYEQNGNEFSKSVSSVAALRINPLVPELFFLNISTFCI